MNNDRTITITIENGKVDVQTSGGNELLTPGCTQNLGRINHQDYPSHGYYNNLDTPTSEELNNLDESTFEKDHQDDTNVLGTDQLRTGFRNPNEMIFKTDGSKHQIGESYIWAFGTKTQYTRYYMIHGELNNSTLLRFKSGGGFRHSYEYFLGNADLSRLKVNALTLVGGQLHGPDWMFNVRGTNFSESLLTGCTFNHVDLTDAVFASTTLNKQKFVNCKIKNTNFINADLSGSTFENCSFEVTVSYPHTNNIPEFKNVDFTNANLKGAGFHNITGFKFVNFTNAVYDQHTQGLPISLVYMYNMRFEES